MATAATQLPFTALQSLRSRSLPSLGERHIIAERKQQQAQLQVRKQQQQQQQQEESTTQLLDSVVQCLQHHTVHVPKAASALAWLDLDQDTDQAFFAASSTPRSTEAANAERADYYTMTDRRAQEIAAASQELHQMFEAATERVVQDDALLQTFGIPEALQQKVRDSFLSHRAGMGQHPIMGRLDLAVDDRGIKAYEYNADSASCLYECGYTQGMWADAVGLGRVGINPGLNLAAELEAAWSDAGVPEGGVLHLMLDDDLEEEYHARYVRDAAQRAGLRTRLVKGVQGLRWEQGKVVDAEGEELRFVWKTWAWETVIDDYRRVADDRSAGRVLSLSDALLSDRVTVWEPLWTVLAGNKAILPVLWDMYPEHPYLLRAEFELSEALRTHPAGYVAKPIVGRCGSNVTMVQGDEVLAKVGGKFAAKEVVHQELRPLPRMDGHSVLVCPWVVRGKCAGIVLRVDEALITTVDSPIECLRIVPEAAQHSGSLTVKATTGVQELVNSGGHAC